MTNREHPSKVNDATATNSARAEQGSAAEAADETLSAELATLAADLRQPLARDSYAFEAGCQSAIQKACAVIDGGLAEAEDMAATRKRPIPESVGPYRIEALLGRGGMGAVYKARHTRLDKVVALKILESERLNSSELVARFEREMKAVGKLDHPHLIRALDAGEADGMHYLAIEFVDGVDLATQIRERGPLPIPVACELVIQAATALQAVQTRGMVHRDIKPANLMLARQEFGPPVVKVLDLGLALLADRHATDTEIGLTCNGQVMGTVDYMAPEQATDSHTVDIRADIYSLGATLYALLTGGPILQDRPRLTLLQKLTVLATESPVPIRDRRPDVSDRLAAIIHTMLALRPEDRYATPTEVIEALRPFAAHADLKTLFEGVPDATESGLLDRGDETALLPTRTDQRPDLASNDAKLPAAAGRSRRRALFGAVAVAATGLLAAVVLLLRTPQGDVEVHIPDEVPDAIRKQIQIRVLGNGTAEVANAANDWKILVQEGTYRVQMTGASDQLEVRDQEITVRRDQQAIVTVVLKKPVEKTGPAVVSQTRTGNADRQFVHWVRSLESPPLIHVRFPDGHLEALPDPMPEWDFTINWLIWMGADADRLGDALLEQTAQRMGGIRLPRLTLTSSSISTTGVIRFLERIDRSDLGFLELHGVSLSDDIFEALGRCPRLNSLSLLCSRRMTGRGLHRLPALKFLQLREEQFLTQDAFQELEQLPNLEILQLGSRSFAQDRIEVIARLPLQTLFLQSCKIDDARLARVAENPRLEFLFLDRNPITDAGLSALKKLKRLARVTLKDTQVTAAGIADLQQALPECQITWTEPEN